MKLMACVLKELESGEASTSYLAYVLRSNVDNVASAITRLQREQLVRIVGTEKFKDSQQRPQTRYIYALTQYGYAKLMGTLAA